MKASLVKVTWAGEGRVRRHSQSPDLRNSRHWITQPRSNQQAARVDLEAEDEGGRRSENKNKVESTHNGTVGDTGFQEQLVHDVNGFPGP